MDRCKVCKQPLNITKGQQCPRCLTVQCPFCGAVTHESLGVYRNPCRHIIAIACSDTSDEDDLGWEVSPFVQWKIRIPEPPGTLDRTHTRSLIEGFGMLIPVLAAYQEDGVDRVQLFDLLLEQVDIHVKIVHWRFQLPGGSLKLESRGTDYFTTKPDELREQVGALIARLTAGFERLVDAR